MITHVPSVAQHPPVGCSHGFGEQSVSAPRHVLVLPHKSSVVIVQTPSGAQQAPVDGGCGQGFGSQSANIVHSPEHCASVVMVQTPLAAQQAPVGASHGFGSHVASMVQAPVQFDWVVIVQAPSKAQHDPVGSWQGFGSHVAPGLPQMLGARHSTLEVTVQLPVGAQHGPVTTSANPVPSQRTDPSSSSPVEIWQLFGPAEVGRNRMVTWSSWSLSREKIPPPSTMEKSSQAALMRPPSVPPPSLRSVKLRSDAWPTATWPKSSVPLSRRGTGGWVPPSSEQPEEIQAAKSGNQIQRKQIRAAPAVVFMLCSQMKPFGCGRPARAGLSGIGWLKARLHRGGASAGNQVSFGEGVAAVFSGRDDMSGRKNRQISPAAASSPRVIG